MITRKTRKAVQETVCPVVMEYSTGNVMAFLYYTCKEFHKYNDTFLSQMPPWTQYTRVSGVVQDLFADADSNL